jgi:hypothetical protein
MTRVIFENNVRQLVSFSRLGAESSCFLSNHWALASECVNENSHGGQVSLQLALLRTNGQSPTPACGNRRRQSLFGHAAYHRGLHAAVQSQSLSGRSLIPGWLKPISADREAYPVELAGMLRSIPSGPKSLSAPGCKAKPWRYEVYARAWKTVRLSGST